MKDLLEACPHGTCGLSHSEMETEECVAIVYFASIGAHAQAVCTDVGKPSSLQQKATAVRATTESCEQTTMTNNIHLESGHHNGEYVHHIMPLFLGV